MILDRAPAHEPEGRNAGVPTVAVADWKVGVTDPRFMERLHDIEIAQSDKHLGARFVARRAGQPFAQSAFCWRRPIDKSQSV